MSNSDNGSKFFKGFMWGALAGGVAGVLLAPDRGSNTRSKIKRKKQEWEPRLKEVKDVIVTEIAPFLEELFQSGQRGAVKVKQAVQEIKKEAQEAQEVVEERMVSPSPQSSPKSSKRRFFRVNK